MNTPMTEMTSIKRDRVQAPIQCTTWMNTTSSTSGSTTKNRNSEQRHGSMVPAWSPSYSSTIPA